MSSVMRMKASNVRLRRLGSGDCGEPNDKLWSISSHRVSGDLEADKGRRVTGAYLEEQPAYT